MNAALSSRDARRDASLALARLAARASGAVFTRASEPSDHPADPTRALAGLAGVLLAMGAMNDGSPPDPAT